MFHRSKEHAMPPQKSTMAWDKILSDMCEDPAKPDHGGNAYMSMEDARCELESASDIALPTGANPRSSAASSPQKQVEKSK